MLLEICGVDDFVVGVWWFYSFCYVDWLVGLCDLFGCLGGLGWLCCWWVCCLMVDYDFVFGFWILRGCWVCWCGLVLLGGVGYGCLVWVWVGWVFLVYSCC